MRGVSDANSFRPGAGATAAVLWVLALSMVSRAQAQDVRLVVVGEIGASEGREAITDPGEMLVVGDSVVWVTQPQTASVHVFSIPLGLVRVVGQRGEGPGEFGSPRWLGLLGDSIWVGDPSLGRLSLFHSESGELVRSVTYIVADPRPGHLPHRPGLLMADGSTWSPGEAQSEFLATGRITELPLSRSDGATGPVEVTTLLHDRATGQIAFPEGGGMFFDQPFAMKDVWTKRPGGAGVTILRAAGSQSTGQALVQRFDQGGSLEHSVTIDLPSVVSASDIVDEYVRGRAELLAALPAWAPRIGPEQVRAALIVPDRLPRAFGLLEGPGGEIWVLVTPADIPSLGQRWLTFDDEGRPKGRVDLAPGIELRWVGAHTALAFRRGAFDVPYVVVYRVERD